MSEPNTPAMLEALSASLSRLVTGAAPGVVAVHSRRARSSGFIWKPGLVVTADEALAEEGDIAVILPGGGTVAATVAGRDPTTDVALLRLAPAGEKAAPVALGETVATAGALVVAGGARDGAPVAAIGAVSFVGGPGAACVAATSARASSWTWRCGARPRADLSWTRPGACWAWRCSGRGGASSSSRPPRSSGSRRALTRTAASPAAILG